MTTLTLAQAAQFLQAHPDWVRKEAKAGRIPGRKMGHIWRFLEEDLVVFIRSGYADHRQAPMVEVSNWQSSNEEKRGGFLSPPHKESALDIRLKQKTSNRPRNSMTS
ncbi:MAG: helix-turn-helix domain-containing protein [Leptospirillum sp.]